MESGYNMAILELERRSVDGEDGFAMIIHENSEVIPMCWIPTQVLRQMLNDIDNQTRES